MKIYILIICLFPITGASWTMTGSGSTAVVGESFNLTCKPDRNNVQTMYWRRNGDVIAAIETSGCQTGVGGNRDYTYTCSSGPKYHLTIPSSAMTMEQQQSVWRCEDPIFGGSIDYTLSVKENTPVTNVTITGEVGYSDVFIIYENQPKQFTCVTNKCRPKATVRFILVGATNINFTEAYETQNNLIITTATQTITTSGGSQPRSIRCEAWNLEGRQPVTSETIVLDVYYASTAEPTLTGYTDETVLYEGDGRVELICQQPGGKPLSNITWSCFGQQGTDNYTESVASSSVQLGIDRDLNGINCSCVIVSDERLGYMKTKWVTFIVYYPPSTPIVHVLESDFPWMENDTETLGCNYTSGYPSDTSYTWIQNGVSLDDETNSTLAIGPLNSSHNGLKIQCKVDNDYTRNQSTSLISQTMVLNVEYAPRIVVDKEPIVVNEGAQLERMCTATGNPAPVVNWYKGSTKLTSGTRTDARLWINVASRNDTGIYTCKAASTLYNNIVLQTEETVEITVLFISLETDKPTKICQDTESAKFNCSVIGTAWSFKFFDWTHSFAGKLIRSIKGDLLAPNVTSLSMDYCGFYDQGTYTCHAGNDIYGNETWYMYRNVIDLKVNAPPVLSVHTQITRNRAANEIKLSVKYMSIPKHETIEWIKDEKVLAQSDKFLQVTTLTTLPLRFYGVNVTVNGYLSTLSIFNPTDADYGIYTFKVQNSEGSANIDMTYDSNTVFPEIPEEKDTSMYFIIGGIAGGGALVIIFVLICSICIYRKCTRNANKQETTTKSKDSKPTTKSDAAIANKKQKKKKEVDKTKFDDLQSYEALSKGSEIKRKKRQKAVISDTYEEPRSKPVSQQYTGLEMQQSNINKGINVPIRPRKNQRDVISNTYAEVPEKPVSQQYTEIDMVKPRVSDGSMYDEIHSRQSNVKATNSSIYDELQEEYSKKY